MNLVGENISYKLTEELQLRKISFNFEKGKLYTILGRTLSGKNPKEDYLKFSKGNGIYSYSFSIYPEKNQPSGSLNFSKLENAQLKFSLLKGKKEDDNDTSYKQKLVNIHGVNYNVLRIIGGSAGLAFIN